MPARVRIEPGDIHPDAAARRMGLTRAEFEAALSRLLARGFPRADPDTGMYDLAAIDTWRRRRHPEIFNLTASGDPRDAKALMAERIARIGGG